MYRWLFFLLCSALYGMTLEEKGQDFEKKGDYHQALEAYLELYKAYPKDMELLCHIGRLYGELKEWDLAEKTLFQCIEGDPDDPDPRAVLAYIYYWQGKYQEALAEAEWVIERHPHYHEIHLLKGGLMYAERHYQQAYQEYKIAFKDNPEELFAERGLIAVKPLVRPSLELKSIYVQEREQDLLTPVTTVQMTTAVEELKLTFPVNDQWMPYAAGVYDLDIQYNLVARVNNYKINHSFQNVGVIYRFGDFWALDMESRVHFARNQGASNLLPFQNRTLWEPQVELSYVSPSHFVVLSGVKDSLVGRLFSINQSKLVSRKWTSVAYEYRFKAPYHGIGAAGTMSWYGSGLFNREQQGSLWLRFRLPAATPDILMRYEFAYRGFKHVLGAYNSFKWRNQHLGKVTYHKEWVPKGCIDLSYTFLFSNTHDLTDQSEIILPGANNTPTPIAKNLFHANIFEALGSYIVWSSLHLEMVGRYYHDTNNYRAWSLFTRLQMTF